MDAEQGKPEDRQTDATQPMNRNEKEEQSQVLRGYEFYQHANNKKSREER